MLRPKGRWEAHRSAPRSARPIAAALGLGFLVLAGCEKAETEDERDKPVALVGADTVTVGETMAYIRAAKVERTLEGLERAVGDLIAIELLQFAAGERKLTPEQEAQRLEWQEQLLRNEFRDSVITKSVVVPDSLVEVYYRDRVGEEIKARHILVPFPPTATAEQKRAPRARAEEALGKARRGESFEELSRQYSESKTAEVGGDLGWFGKKDMVPAFEQAAFALKPGEISEVVETRFGFHVIKVEDRRKKSLEEVRSQIEEALAQPLRRETEQGYVERMMSESGLEFYEAYVDTLVALFARDSAATPSPAQRDLPIATWNKGRLTVGDIVERYNALPRENQAAVRALDRDRMLNALAPFVRNRMLIARAEAAGIELDADRQRKLDERVQGLVIGDMLKERVKEDVVISDSAVRAAYAEDSTRYGKSLEEAELEIRQALIQERLARANSWERQRELIHEIARGVEGKVEVRRVEENYELVLRQFASEPAAGEAAPGPSPGAPPGDMGGTSPEATPGMAAGTSPALSPGAPPGGGSAGQPGAGQPPGTGPR